MIILSLFYYAYNSINHGILKFLCNERKCSRRGWDKLLKESGVDVFNGAQGRILYVLWEHSDLTITEIGKLTSLAKTTLTGMLDRMETSGLIERIPDKKNRRQIFIAVTEKAKEYRNNTTGYLIR